MRPERPLAGPLGLLLLTLLLGLGAYLRLEGDGLLLPSRVEPDPHVAIQVQRMEDPSPAGWADVNMGKYPHLLAWLTVALTEPDPAPARGAPLEAHLAHAAWPVQRVRRVGGWVSTLAVLGTWLLARRAAGTAGACVAAALVATSLLAVHFGAQARPHAVAGAFTALCLWASARHVSVGTLGSLALASLFGALAVGSLQSGLALGFPILAAHLLASRRAGARAWWALGGDRALRLVGPALALAVSLVVLAPFLLPSGTASAAGRMEVEEGVVNQAGHLLFLKLFNGEGFGILLSALWRWEPALLVGGALATLVLLSEWRRRRSAPDVEEVPPAGASPLWGQERWVVLAHAVPYVVVCGLYERVYERFLIPLLPALATLTAWGLVHLARRGGRGRALAAVAGLALVGFPTAVAWNLTRIRKAPSTPELAAAWLEEHAEPDARVLVNRDLRLPLFQTAGAAREEQADVPIDPEPTHALPWVEYQHHAFGDARPASARELVWLPITGPDGVLLRHLVRDPHGYVEATHGDLFVTPVYARGRIHPGLEQVAKVFRNRGEVLARFTPDGAVERSPHPLGYQDETCPGNPHQAWRILNAERMGPTIEVVRAPYRVPPDRR